jgi:hypothetical protein
VHRNLVPDEVTALFHRRKFLALAASGALASCRLGSGAPPAPMSRGQATRWDAL